MELGELSLDNILGTDEIEGLFTSESEPSEGKGTSEKEENSDNEEKTTEVDVNNLFDGKPESVGSAGEDNKEQENTSDSSNKGSSPKNDFYSSIAKALKNEGILPDLDDEVVDNVKGAEDFAEIIEQQIQSMFDERQKRIDKALNLGIEASEIKKYENDLAQINSISEKALSAENESGDKLRQSLIYQDFINRGYTKERALREVKKSFDAGTDIEDAKEALAGIKEYVQEGYDDLIRQEKEKQDSLKNRRQKEEEDLKKSIFEDKEFFKELNVNENTRRKIYDNLRKPVYKDENGNFYTAIQKYQKENPIGFVRNLGLVYTLTNGFTDLNGLIKGKVNKEMRKGIRELEHTLSTSSIPTEGNLKFMGGVSEEYDSFINKGWNLDI